MILFAGILNSQLWHLVPLILAVSLVYGATRHELLSPILHHAWKTVLWMHIGASTATGGGVCAAQRIACAKMMR